jgi:hypothetical protein
MATTAQMLQHIYDSKKLIKQALVDKGSNITASTPFRDYANKINDLEFYTLDKTEIDHTTAVVFYDYDGTILYAFDKNDIMGALKRPSNISSPNVKSAVATGWNKSLKEIQDEVEISGYTEVGQVYTHTFEKYNTSAAMKVSVVDKELATISMVWRNLGLTDKLVEINEEFIIDWGDGTSNIFIPGVDNQIITHTYSNIGNYDVLMYYGEWWDDVHTGEHEYPFNTEIYLTNCAPLITGIEYGKLITIKNYSNQPIETVLIHEDVVRNNASLVIDSYDFNSISENYAIKAIVIPNMITSISNVDLQARRNLKCFVLGSSTIVKGEVCFTGSGLEGFCMYPNIKYSVGCCQDCYNLKRLGIIGIKPIEGGTYNGIKEIPDSMFTRCKSLKYVKFPVIGTDPTVDLLSDKAFSYCGVLVYDFREFDWLPICRSTTFAGILSDAIIKVNEVAYAEALQDEEWVKLKEHFKLDY